jgi:putative N6-adenine-specific DNA methylase
MPRAAPQLDLVATCALGLEEILDGELAAMGVGERARETGAVAFRGGWADCWRANWRLRTANRVLVALGSWAAPDGAALAAGARALVGGRTAERSLARGALDAGALLHPDRRFVLQATTSGSGVADSRWAVLKAKDGLVDGQRDRYGRRSDVDRENPDLPLRLRLHRDRATLLLDTSGEPLDRRGYRAGGSAAPVREQLAAACVLASGWDGRGPVVDPMCGTGTLLIEAGWLALGRAPGALRAGWAFERLPGFDAREFERIRAERLPAPAADLHLFGNDTAGMALRAARANLELAGLGGRTTLTRGPFAGLVPPSGPGLVVVNPPYGERVQGDEGQWKALGDLLKQRFKGWKAAVLAGGEGLGKGIGLRPRRRLPVRNGPLPARILVFDLF